jgi:hypothetical protein
LRLFPNASIDVLAFHPHKAQFEGFAHPRLHVSFFHVHPRRMLFHIIKWACRLNHTALTFGGPRRIRPAKWLRRVLPTRHAYSFETLEDFCALLRHLLDANGGGEYV